MSSLTSPADHSAPRTETRALTAASERTPVYATAAGLMAVSGFAGLGYQIVWTQQFGVWLGHEIVAVLAVVAAFFGGLGLGACALARRIGRSHRPAAWYAGCEAAIGLWGLALAWLLPVANPWLAKLTGPAPDAWWQWAIAFLGPGLLLLPATFAMGATLPALERVTDRLSQQGFAIGGLYAANTFGAVAGVLASTFVLVPWLGLAHTAKICVGLNLLCAAVALSVLPGAAATKKTDAPARDASAPRGVLAVLLATGALGIGYEVVVVRVLSQVTEDTVYTFALLLAVYLLGTAAGAAFYQRRLAGPADPARLRTWLLCALAAACLVGTASLWTSQTLQTHLTTALGAGYGSALAVEAAVAVAAFALPTFVMGGLFSHLCVEVKLAQGGLGTALGVNTLGAALAPFVFGVLLVPWLGPRLVLVAIALGYLACVPLPQWRRPQVWAPAFAGVALGALGGQLAFVDLPEGGRILSFEDGVMASVSVVEDAAGVARLRIDNRQQEGSSASLLTDGRQAYLPLLLHPAPKHALFLGLGTGITAGAAAEDGTLQVDAVELLPEVVSAAAWFAPALGAAPEAPGPRVRVADARRYVRATDRSYDVIVADLFHPARSGAGALYTVEHFAAIRGRLNAGGLFCQWLPLHQLDLATLASIVRSYTAVYPQTWAVLATNSLDTPVIGLITRADGDGDIDPHGDVDTRGDHPHGNRASFDLATLRARLAGFALPARQAQLQLQDDFALLGGVIADPAALRAFAASAALNTDDRPLVAHRAPRITYVADSSPRERLLTLLNALPVPAPAVLLGAPQDGAEAEWQQRLAAYWDARNRFIEAGMGVRPSGDAREMLAQVREPLLRIVRASADFRPAYDPLLQMARAVARTDAAAAADLAAELAAANPSRPEAEQLRQALHGH